MKALGPHSRKAALLYNCVQIFRGLIGFFKTFSWVLEKTFCLGRKQEVLTKMWNEGVLGVAKAAPGEMGMQGYKCKDGLRESKRVVRADRVHHCLLILDSLQVFPLL